MAADTRSTAVSSMASHASEDLDGASQDFRKKEALFWERDADARRHLLNQEEQIFDLIDEELSREIVQKRADWHGQLSDPWLSVLMD